MNRSEGTRSRLLVVDDDQLTLRMLGRALEQAGFQVESALDGAEALSKLAESPYDGVVADGVMPLVDGYELCRLIKEDSATQDLPVIIYTGDPNPVNRLWARICGADLFLTKQPDLGPLLTAVKALPRRPEAQPQAGGFTLGNTHHIQSRLAQQLQRRLLENALRTAVGNLYEHVREPEAAAWALGSVLSELALEGALFVILPLAAGRRGFLMSEQHVPQALLEAELGALGLQADDLTWSRREGRAESLSAQDLDHHAFLLSDPGSAAFGWWGVMAPRTILSCYLPLFNAADEEFQRVYRTMMLLDQLQAANEARTQFVRTVSHEIRNPLTAAQAALELIDEGLCDAASPKGQKLIATARRSIRRLLSLATGVLDLEKIEAGEFVGERQPVNLVDLCRNLQEEFAPLAQDRGLTLNLDLRGTDHQVEADPERLAQCVINLLSNALAHGPRDSEILLRLEGSAEQCCLSVIDQGPGVPLLFQPRLFQKFQQSEPGRKQGTGLGLAITRALAEQMGAELGYRDNPEGGAVFFLNLPCRVQTGSPAQD